MREIGGYRSSEGEAYLFLFDAELGEAKAVRLYSIPQGHASVGWPVCKVDAQSVSDARNKLIAHIEAAELV